MSIVKLNNRSVKDVTAFGSISSLGSLTHIATQTASSSANISFTSGINNTYKEYMFFCVNIHPATDNVKFNVNFSVDAGSNYNVTKTTTIFRAFNKENNSSNGLNYESGSDLAQSTSGATISIELGNGNDESCSGILHLFEPSSSTFVKHFTSNFNTYQYNDITMNHIAGGYGNTTSAIDAVQFSMSSGNIDSGQILLFGLN